MPSEKVLGLDVITVGDPNGERKRAYQERVDDLIQVGPSKWILPRNYLKFAKRIKEFQVRSTDCWILGFPRSGTTMTQDLVWLIMNNANFDKLKKTAIVERVPFFEDSAYVMGPFLRLLEKETDPIKRQKLQEKIRSTEKAFDIYDDMEERRFFKSHLPFELLPNNLLTSQSKMLYVCRNIKDVILSLHRLLSDGGDTYNNFIAPFETFWKFFKNSTIPFTPYWEHVNTGWARRNVPNVKFICYENLITDLKKSTEEIAKFLDKPLTEEQIESIVNFMQFENYSKSTVLNKDEHMKYMVGAMKFFGTGKMNNWKEKMSAEIANEMDEWIVANLKKFQISIDTYSLDYPMD